MRALVVAAATLSLLGTTRTARADDEPIPIRLEPHGTRISIVGPLASKRCDEPCVLSVPAGDYVLTSGSEKTTMRLDRPSLIEHRRGAPALRTTGAIVGLVGLVVATGVGLTALGICKSRQRLDAYGRTESYNPCSDDSDATRFGLFAVAGVGFGAAVVGGILFFASGPHLTVTDWSPSTSRDRRGIRSLAFSLSLHEGAQLRPGLSASFSW
jgi:hypothetical protein